MRTLEEVYSAAADKMIVAHCHCCNTDFTPAEWERLQLVGLSRFDADEPLREYRNCTCRSTLSRVVEDVVQLHERKLCELITQ